MPGSYLVVWDADPDRGQSRGSLECEAANADDAIGNFEESMHARALPRSPLQVRAYYALPGLDPLDPPPREKALSAAVIEPAPFKVRFGAPQVDPAGGAEIPVEIDGRYCGALHEVRGPGGSGWVARSPRGELDGACRPPPPEWPVPDPKPLSLGEACRSVERLAAAERERWASDQGWYLEPPSPHPKAPRPDPRVRFAPPTVGSDGRAEVEVEIDYRLSVVLREEPSRGGSRWAAAWTRLEPDRPWIRPLEGIGKSKPLALGEACREALGAVRPPAPRTSMADCARAAKAEARDPERCR